MAYKSESVLDRGIAPVSFMWPRSHILRFAASDFGSIFRLFFRKGKMGWAQIFCCHDQPSSLISTSLTSPCRRGKMVFWEGLLSIQAAWAHGVLSFTGQDSEKLKKKRIKKQTRKKWSSEASSRHSWSPEHPCPQKQDPRTLTQGLVQGPPTCSAKGKGNTINHKRVQEMAITVVSTDIKPGMRNTIFKTQHCCNCPINVNILLIWVWRSLGESSSFLGQNNLWHQGTSTEWSWLDMQRRAN